MMTNKRRTKCPPAGERPAAPAGAGAAGAVHIGLGRRVGGSGYYLSSAVDADGQGGGGDREAEGPGHPRRLPGGILERVARVWKS